MLLFFNYGQLLHICDAMFAEIAAPNPPASDIQGMIRRIKANMTSSLCSTSLNSSVNSCYYKSIATTILFI